MAANMKKVESSNIAEIGYNRRKKQLTVRFNNGALYQYEDVPADTYTELMDADSKGGYFSKNIRLKFTFERLEAPATKEGE